MRFHLIRLSALKRSQIDSFERQTDHGGPFTREAWFRAVFGEPIDFLHRGSIFHYVPTPSGSSGISGRIGRKLAVYENDPPEAGLADVVRDSWRASHVAIDPRHHEDGQKVAMEFNAQVGSPLSLLQSLAEKINSKPEPFMLEVAAIVSSSSFWEFVENHKGSIVFVEFEFVAPNMFGATDDYNEEMRELHRTENIEKARIILESKSGLNLNTERVRQAVNYTSRGTGSSRAKSKSGQTYNSNNNIEKFIIPEKEIGEKHGESLIRTILNAIFGL